MKRNVVAAVALAVCAMGLGAPAALSQEDGTTEPTSTASAEEPDTTEEPDPTTEPDDPVDVTLAINPTAAQPGEAITATATCDDPDGAILVSEVLGAVILSRNPEGHQPWALRGSTTVSEDAQPGEYEVYAECDAGAAYTTITVVPGGRADDDQDDQQVSRTPRGAPETGGGPDAVDPLTALLGVGAVAGLAAIGILGRRSARR